MIRHGQNFNKTEEIKLPLKPLSRSEQYLAYICENGGIGPADTHIKFNSPNANSISMPASMLATITAIATGCGVTIKNNDDLYNLGCLFYDYINANHEIAWDILQTTFNNSVAVSDGGLISVNSVFLDILKGFFDNTFLNFKDEPFNSVSLFNSLPIYPFYVELHEGDNIFGNIRYEVVGDSTVVYVDGEEWASIGAKGLRAYMKPTSGGYAKITFDSKYYSHTVERSSLYIGDCVYFSYTGGYNWDNVESKKDNESIALPIPGNLGQLVGQGSADFWDNTNGLVGKSDILTPVIDNSSINICEPYSFLSSSDTNGEESDLPLPQSRVEKLLYAIITGNSNNIEPAKSRVEHYLHYILKK